MSVSPRKGVPATAPLYTPTTTSCISTLPFQCLFSLRSTFATSNAHLWVHHTLPEICILDFAGELGCLTLPPHSTPLTPRYFIVKPLISEERSPHMETTAQPFQSSEDREHVCWLPSPLSTHTSLCKVLVISSCPRKETKFPYHRFPSNLEFPFFLSILVSGRSIFPK